MNLDYLEMDYTGGYSNGFFTGFLTGISFSLFLCIAVKRFKIV